MSKHGKYGKYGSVFVLLNLGSEMLYVVSQRLKAQNITDERCFEVLDTITSHLISPQLMDELIKSPGLNHDEMKHLIENIAQSSIMRLDAASKDRLWDLITMMFKWQLFMCDDTFLLTIRHLYEIETFAMTPKTQTRLHDVQNIVDDLAGNLSAVEKSELLQYLRNWCRDFDVRVSLLLRLGLQNADASFTKTPAPKYQHLVDNLGENIYAAAAHLHHPTAEQQPQNTTTLLEVNTVVGELLGTSAPPQSNAVFKLSLEDYDDTGAAATTDVYSTINVQLRNSCGVFDDEHTHPLNANDGSIHEELIQMLDQTTNY